MSAVFEASAFLEEYWLLKERLKASEQEAERWRGEFERLAEKWRQCEGERDEARRLAEEWRDAALHFKNCCEVPLPPGLPWEGEK